MPATSYQIHAIRSHKRAIFIFKDWIASALTVRLHRRKIGYVGKALNF
jgi:hypothetical protein